MVIAEHESLSSDNFETQTDILNDIYKSAILSTLGRVYFHDKLGYAGKDRDPAYPSLWMVPHKTLQSNCEGLMYIAAESLDGTNFKSIGACCLGCEETTPKFEVNITKEELVIKIRDDEIKDKALEKMAYIKGVSTDQTRINQS